MYGFPGAPMPMGPSPFQGGAIMPFGPFGTMPMGYPAMAFMYYTSRKKKESEDEGSDDDIFQFKKTFG